MRDRRSDPLQHWFLSVAVTLLAMLLLYLLTFLAFVGPRALAIPLAVVAWIVIIGCMVVLWSPET